MDEERRSPPITGHLLIGVAIAAIGLIFILGELGLIEPAGFWRYWPLLLIVYGLIKLLTSPYGGQRIWGGTVLVVGILFMLSEWTDIDISWGVIFALAVFALGVRLIWQALTRQRDRGPSEDSWMREWAIFGGGERRNTSKTFRGGELNAAFGGIDVDLRGAVIDQQQATLEVLVMFGGIDVFVPRDWEVILQPVALFGGCSDSRSSMEREAQPATGAGKRLVVRGTVLFGGFEVKS
jgi:predicted membrane protein